MSGFRFGTDIKGLVRKYWTDGLSQREIGRRIGISKNSVPGIVRRLGLPKRYEGKPRGIVARKIEIAKPKAPPAIGPIGAFPENYDSCRFIAGEPDAQFQCCAQPGFPYCEYHMGRVRQKAKAS